MPLALLIDENISPVVAEQLAIKRPDIQVLSIHVWREGAFLSASDDEILAAAHADGLTLVTYDTQILSDLRFWFDQAIPFAGLIFVDDASIAAGDFGALVRALIYLWDREHEAEWLSRLVFLPAPSLP
jgi:predicted nuclease of predicted toxin-antitoxin system